MFMVSLSLSPKNRAQQACVCSRGKGPKPEVEWVGRGGAVDGLLTQGEEEVVSPVLHLPESIPVSLQAASGFWAELFHIQARVA